MEQSEKKFKSYKNVYKEALMWGLPLKMFMGFGAASLVNLVILALLVMIGVWYVSLLMLLLNFWLYFLFKNLIAKYGVYFIDKLYAHHIEHKFTIIRRTRTMAAILAEKKRRKHD
jgi:hypothetical protein